MTMSLCVVALAACVVVVTSQSLKAVIDECDTTPSPGSCHNRRPIHVWTFSKRTQSCQKIRGCYTLGDRNVFRNKVDCRDTCGKPSQCSVTPRTHPCARPRTIWTFNRRLRRCVRKVGCYRTSDTNVFHHQHTCRKTCGRL